MQPRRTTHTHPSHPVTLRALSRRWLHKNNLKAYTANTNLMDPKQRRDGNLLTSWCSGEAVKLWDTVKHRPVSDYGLSAAHANEAR